MKNLITIAMVVLLAVLCLELNRDNQRLRANERALKQSVMLYQTTANRSVASVESLTLELNEFKRQHREDRATIEELGIRLPEGKAVVFGQSLYCRASLFEFLANRHLFFGIRFLFQVAWFADATGT